MEVNDLISRQAVIDAIRGWVKKAFEDWGNAETEIRCFNAIYPLIMALPSAQSEIIRCKDCRYYQDNNNGYPHMDCKWDANETPDADDFCSGAERRTDG